MKNLHPLADENKMWEIAFPHYYPQAVAEGVFIMPSEEVVRQQLELTGGGDKRQRAIFQLDMALVNIWPFVAHLFQVDFFPHRLAAATDVLRAIDFGEDAEQRVAALAAVLVEALNNLEIVAAGEQPETILQAAEDDRSDE